MGLLITVWTCHRMITKNDRVVWTYMGHTSSVFYMEYIKKRQTVHNHTQID